MWNAFFYLYCSIVKAAIFYSSLHGRTRKVATEAIQRLKIQVDVFNVKDQFSKEQVVEYDLLLFFTPTYGDEELRNYYGYDTYSFGALSILRRWFNKLNAREFFTPLSLDSFPRVNWAHFHDWIDQLNGRILSNV